MNVINNFMSFTTFKFDWWLSPINHCQCLSFSPKSSQNDEKSMEKSAFLFSSARKSPLNYQNFAKKLKIDFSWKFELYLIEWYIAYLEYKSLAISLASPNFMAVHWKSSINRWSCIFLVFEFFCSLRVIRGHLDG